MAFVRPFRRVVSGTLLLLGLLGQDMGCFGQAAAPATTEKPADASPPGQEQAAPPSRRPGRIPDMLKAKRAARKAAAPAAVPSGTAGAAGASGATATPGSNTAASPGQIPLMEEPPIIKPTPPYLGTAPLLMQPPPPPPPPVHGIQTASEAIKAILGLVAIFALAYLAGNARIQALEQKLQIAQVMTAGLPFVLLGALAHMQQIGILSANVLWEIRPLLALGLGWIGFSIGFRFNARMVDSLTPDATRMSLHTTGFPFCSILAACALLLVWVEHWPANAEFVRDAMILATAGAMTAYSAPRLLEARGASGSTVDRIAAIVELEQLAGVFGLMLVAAYFRPQASMVSWQLPGTAWLFMTLGMGATVGGVIYGALGRIESEAEFSLMVLGSVCFASGMASYLRLSPLVVSFIVGIILVNLPGGPKDQIREALARMERPIYLLFLLVAGSLWDPIQWQGWVLMLLFVATRLFGKWLGVVVAEKRTAMNLTQEERRSLIFSPIGALSIAIVVNAQDLYPDATVSWMVTAVIGGAILTEIIVQVASRSGAITEPEPWGVS